jgi:hypothetical protein
MQTHGNTTPITIQVRCSWVQVGVEKKTYKGNPCHALIETEEGKSPPFGPIYQLTPVEWEAIAEYVHSNLKCGHIWHSVFHLFCRSSCSFHPQKDWEYSALHQFLWSQCNHLQKPLPYSPRQWSSWLVFESPVYWTEKRLWTEPNWTDGNRTIGCSCPNIFTSPVHGSSMIWHLNRPPKDWPQPVVDQTLVASSLRGVNKC